MKHDVSHWNGANHTSCLISQVLSVSLLKAQERLKPLEKNPNIHMTYFVIIVSRFFHKMKTTVKLRAGRRLNSQPHHELFKSSPSSKFAEVYLLFRLLHPGLLSLKPLDLDMYRRESFLLELIAQRVGGFLLCFSNQSWSFYEGNHTGYTMLLCLLKFRLWESKIQLWGVACWRWFRCLHPSYFLWADFSVTATNVFPVCHYCLKLLLA